MRAATRLSVSRLRHGAASLCGAAAFAAAVPVWSEARAAEPVAADVARARHRNRRARGRARPGACERAGLDDDAHRLFALLEKMADTRVVGAGSWPLAYLAIGDVDNAYAWLARAVEKVQNHLPDEGFFNLMIIKANVQANPVLEEPRFLALRARIGG
jgi:hypothetical protein